MPPSDSGQAVDVPEFDPTARPSMWRFVQTVRSAEFIVIFGGLGVLLLLAAVGLPNSMLPFLLTGVLVCSLMIWSHSVFRGRMPRGSSGVVRGEGTVTVRARRLYFPTYVVTCGCAGIFAALGIPWVLNPHPAGIVATVLMVLVVLWSIGQLIAARRGLNRAPIIEISTFGIRLSGISYEHEVKLDVDTTSTPGLGPRGPCIAIIAAPGVAISSRYRTKIFRLDRIVRARLAPSSNHFVINVLDFDCDPMVLLGIVREFAPEWSVHWDPRRRRSQ